MAKLLDDPTIQDYLKGVNPNLPPEEPGFQTQTQQFVPNSVFPEQQQRVADNPALMDTPANTTVPDPAVQPAAAQPPKITSILDLIRANEPVQDPTLDARYKKAAMLDSLGQAFGNLAGAVGVGIGATVPKLPVDNNIARLYGARDTEKQRLLQQKRDWDRQMLQGAIQEMGMSAQERKDKEAADRWQKDYDLKVSDNKAKWADATAKAKNQAEKDEATRVYREKDLAIKEKNANTSAFRASQSGTKETALEQGQRLYFPHKDPITGEQKTYSQSDTGEILARAQKFALDPANANSKWPGMLAATISAYQFSPDTRGRDLAIARGFLDFEAYQKADQEDQTRRANTMLGFANLGDQPKIPFAPTTPNEPPPPVPGTITGPAVGSHAKAGEKKTFDKNKFLAK